VIVVVEDVVELVADERSDERDVETADDCAELSAGELALLGAAVVAEPPPPPLPQAASATVIATATANETILSSVMHCMPHSGFCVVFQCRDPGGVYGHARGLQA
jgi:hypothetical protein